MAHQAGIRTATSLVDIKEYLMWVSPWAYVQDWSGCKFMLIRLSPRQHHHHSSSSSQEKSWYRPFSSCPTFMGTQHCTSQPHVRTPSVFREAVRQAFFPIAHNDNLLIIQTQPHLITLLFCGRLEQGSTIKSSVFILAIHCLHSWFRRQWHKSALSHTHPIQLRLSCH